MIQNRRGLIAGAAAFAAGAAAVDLRRPAVARSVSDGDGQRLDLTGALVQGGFVKFRTRPGATIRVGDETVGSASRTGLFIVGFDRDAPLSTTLSIVETGQTIPLEIQKGHFPETSINGLPPATVAPSDPALLARIRRELAAKTAAFQSRDDTENFADGFTWPLDSYRVSSEWGAQRILNGTPARPHYGIDLAAPQGTPIHAPAPGLVVFAEPDMFFEGGLVLIDHGQGLITCYLHQSRLDVAVGQRLRRGDPIGLVGMKGRATGPHLCWRMKWRDRNLDPSLMTGVTTSPRTVGASGG